ncbi:DUF2889 domain-containing protein [Rhizorhabdus wittichii]|uniref:DUF2889 domain-containing protein n=1 Tax=Rhizorhabdus wittichii TaxID=160791 RepID=A0A975HD79_9SPHN|nr:DUF2889 domain-containing protein [Rhizorhabdus wittichii]QTH21135.1 DUF2889 domain-containing protein [Rhizorhabdus wittichii]
MGDAYPRIGGRLRRLIDLRREPDGAVVGWLEDDFHHFGVTIEHRDGVMTDVRAVAVRAPFTTCPAATLGLKGMIGHALAARSTEIGRMVSMRRQCTHMFDLAGLAMAHAAAGRAHRRYEALVEDREIAAWEQGHRRLLGAGAATLLRDGAPVLTWAIDRRAITGPADWAGQPLVEGFRERTEAMDIEAAEDATVLRRAVMVAAGRTLDPDLYPTARDRGQSGVCYTFLEENRDRGLRNFGSTLNYEASSEGMLSHLAERP